MSREAGNQVDEKPPLRETASSSGISQDSLVPSVCSYRQGYDSPAIKPTTIAKPVIFGTSPATLSKPSTKTQQIAPLEPMTQTYGTRSQSAPHKICPRTEAAFMSAKTTLPWNAVAVGKVVT